jgi:hypothetical protein
VVIEKLTPYIYKIKLKRVIITANHDRLKSGPKNYVNKSLRGQDIPRRMGASKINGGIEISFIVFVGSHILGSS